MSPVIFLLIVLVHGFAIVMPHVVQGFLLGATAAWQLGMDPELQPGWIWFTCAVSAGAFSLGQALLRWRSARAADVLGSALIVAWAASGALLGARAEFGGSALLGGLGGIMMGLTANARALEGAFGVGVKVEASQVTLSEDSGMVTVNPLPLSEAQQFVRRITVNAFPIAAAAFGLMVRDWRWASLFLGIAIAARFLRSRQDRRDAEEAGFLEAAVIAERRGDRLGAHLLLKEAFTSPWRRWLRETVRARRLRKGAA